MCRKIRCDGESWKVFGFLGELNKAQLWLGAGSDNYFIHAAICYKTVVTLAHH